jgi:DNA polymerase-3 subunit delta
MPSITPDQATKEILQGKLAPIYFLEGAESYYIDKLCDLIVETSLSPQDKDFNLSLVYGKETNMGQLIQLVRKFPMFAERQVVVLKDANQMKELTDKALGEKLLIPYIKAPQPSTILVICHKEDTMDGRKPIRKVLIEHAVHVDSKKIYDNKLPEWIETQVSAKGYKISDKASRMLSDSLGNDLAKIDHEIEKLAINLKTKGATIDEHMIERFVGISKEYNVFEFSNAIGQKNMAKAFRIIQYAESNPRDFPFVVLVGQMYSFFVKVLLVHTSADKSERGLMNTLGNRNPFAIKEFMVAAQHFSLGACTMAFGVLRKADLKSKGVDSNGTEEGALMRELVFELLQLR